MPRPKTQGEYIKRKAAKALFGLTTGKMESPEQRQLLAYTLSKSSNEKVRQLANLARDYAYQGTSIVRLMEIVQISYEAVGREFQSLMRTEGLMRQASHLPDLMEQTAIDARSETHDCLSCDGTGKVMMKVKTSGGEQERLLTCKVCRGSGKERVLGDIERLKLVFETTGLIGKGGGINLGVNLDLRNVRDDERVEDVVASVGKIIDGEVVGG